MTKRVVIKDMSKKDIVSNSFNKNYVLKSEVISAIKNLNQKHYYAEKLYGSDMPTTTAMVLAQGMIKEGIKNVAKIEPS